MIQLFYVSVFLVLFSYFGYPITLVFFKFFKNHKHEKAKIYPEVSLIITVYNEEQRIREKLNNTLQLDYPKNLLQIIVASDGSTDNTNNIVREYSDRGIFLLDVKDRKGKENAQNEAIKIANGEIIVFSDTATILDKTGLLEIISNFSDPTIGCVSSEDRMIETVGNTTGKGGEGFYIKYEMWLRRLESEVNSVVGLSGSFFAARREVCKDFSSKMQSDFRTLLSSMKMGLRGISDPNTIGYYHDIKDKSREFQRKVRTVLRGLAVFFNHIEFLNVFKFGMFSYQYFCHKLLRWLVPIFLLGAFGSGAVLFSYSLLYKIFFSFQIVFYLLALIGILFPFFTRILLVRIPSFFVVVNVSILMAWLKFLKGERVTHWQPSIR